MLQTFHAPYFHSWVIFILPKHCRGIVLATNHILCKDSAHSLAFVNNVQIVKPLLRIHDILAWIRIRIRIWIRGYMPLTNGSGSGCGSGSCYFRRWPSTKTKKTKKKLLCSLLFEGPGGSKTYGSDQSEFGSGFTTLIYTCTRRIACIGLACIPIRKMALLWPGVRSPRSAGNSNLTSSLSVISCTSQHGLNSRL